MTTPKKKDWSTTPNARRHRKMLHVTMSPEGIEELDYRRGKLSRGAMIEFFLYSVPTLEERCATGKEKRKRVGR
jgi:hypothetical protein